MTATLDTVTKKKEPAEESAELAAARELVRQAKEQGLSLTGPDGLLKQLTKTVLETALDEEMTEHLGYERRAPAAGGNVRNGTRSKTVLTESDRPCRDRRAAGSGRHVRAADRAQAAAPPVRGRRDRAVAVRQGADHRGDLGALRRDLRRLGVEGDDQPDHRQGDRGDERLVGAAAGRGLRGDLHRRDRGQGPRRPGRQPADLRRDRGHPGRRARHPRAVGRHRR